MSADVQNLKRYRLILNYDKWKTYTKDTDSKKNNKLFYYYVSRT